MNVYYNDIDPYCCKVLRKQIHLGNLPEGHVDERDIRTIRASELVGYQHIHLFAGIGGFPLGFKWAGFPDHISILTGGFPCQDISNAGKRAGIDGERSGLWSEMYRLICDIRPRYVCVENVAALLGRGIERVLGDLAACGYDAEWQILSAAAFGAPHLRERVFIVAHTNSYRFGTRAHKSQRQPKCGRQTYIGIDGKNGSVAQEYAMADPDFQGLEVGPCFGKDARQELTSFERSCSTGTGIWSVEPHVCRVANGVPSRVERLRGLGNSIVPQIPEYIARCIMAHAAESESVA